MGETGPGSETASPEWSRTLRFGQSLLSYRLSIVPILTVFQSGQTLRVTQNLSDRMGDCKEQTK